MTTWMTSRFTRACLFAVALGGAVPAFAVPLTDLRAEDLVPMASQYKQALNLDANQQTLFSQVESRSRAILRERTRRRDALQEQAKAMLGKPEVELRDLNKLMEAENAATEAEDRQLRELWLGLNDALTDKQRVQVAALLNEQLMRVVPEGRPSGERDNADGGVRGMGGRGSRHGGMGGRGGPGGASMNIGG